MSEFRALLIDDEEELVVTLVERLGYRGIEAEYSLDGYDALSKMRSGDFQVVVLDLKLPGLGGLEVLGRLEKDYPDVPVLLITGHGSPEGEEQPKPEGAFDYLVKPVNLDDLIAKMREAVASR
jgi:DNA-binding NtrC family response regulator